MENDIKDILNYVNYKNKIPLNKIEKWMASEDIEVQGAAYRIFDQLQHLIETMPEMKDIIHFYISFFRRCIIENPEGEYSENRWTATYSLVRFYKALKKDVAVPKNFLAEIRLMLSEVYKGGDEAVRQAIVDGSLEHLFEDSEILNDFKDWKNDNILKLAFEKALKFSKG